MVGVSLTFTTVRSKAGSDALARLMSVTVITIPAVVSTSALVGVPVSAPVFVLKDAQDGWLVMLNVNVSPTSTSLPVGVKL